jgi:hypothetical protein
MCAALAVAPRAFAQAKPPPELADTYRGVYARINMTITLEFIRRLAPAYGTDRRQAMRMVEGRPGGVMPPVLYAYASTLAEDYGERAIFWYHVARVRAVYDALRIKDKTARAGVVSMRKYISKDLAYAQYYRRDRLLPAVHKALAWDLDNPRDYDQRWIALYGDVARTSDGSDADIQVPESEWPGILKHVHETHLKSVEAFVAEKK